MGLAQGATGQQGVLFPTVVTPRPAPAVCSEQSVQSFTGFPATPEPATPASQVGQALEAVPGTRPESKRRCCLMRLPHSTSPNTLRPVHRGS